MPLLFPDTERIGRFLHPRIPKYVRHLRWISLAVAIYHLTEERPLGAVAAGLMALLIGPTSKWVERNVGPPLRAIPWSAGVIAPIVTLIGTANGFDLGWSLFSLGFWVLFLFTALLGKKAFSPSAHPHSSGPGSTAR